MGAFVSSNNESTETNDSTTDNTNTSTANNSTANNANSSSTANNNTALSNELTTCKTNAEQQKKKYSELEAKHSELQTKYSELEAKLKTCQESSSTVSAEAQKIASDIETLYQEVMDSIVEVLKKDGVNKDDVISLMMNYKPFTLTPGTSYDEKTASLSDIIENHLSDLVINTLSPLVMGTIDDLSNAYNFTKCMQTSGNGGTTACPTDMFFASIVQLILSFAVFAASAVVMEFKESYDIVASGKDLDKAVYMRFVSKEDNDGIHADKAAFDNSLKTIIQPIINGLYLRLFATLWMPKIIPSENDEEKIKIIKFALTNAKTYDMVKLLTLNEENIKAITYFIYWVEALAGKHYSSNTGQYNALSPAFFKYMVDNDIKDFSKLNKATKEYLKYCYGFFKDGKIQFDSLKVDEVKKLIGTVEKKNFYLSKAFLGSESFALMTNTEGVNRGLEMLRVIVLLLVCLAIAYGVFIVTRNVLMNEHIDSFDDY